jgi:hypothetical protein
MPLIPCLECGRLSEESRCPQHRKTAARGYGGAHQRLRREAIHAHPWCAQCGHEADPITGHCGDLACKRCPLQLDHLDPLSKQPARQTTGRYQVLCRRCNRAKSNR